MADLKKQLHPQQWLGRPILSPEHVQDLETRSAINEFHAKMPRAQAEQAAHDSYVKEHRERAAAHHLAGMKAAMATGNHQDARKHWAMYDLHLKGLGKDSIGAVPPEIEKRMMDEHGDKPVYKFKTHKGDLYALHEPTKSVAPAEGTPVQKAEDELFKGEGKQCKWRLGERRCQRRVKDGYCHSHVDHWANKIKQADHDALEKAGLEKAWPKNNEENTQNALGFASGTPHAPIARDALLETGIGGDVKESDKIGSLPVPASGELYRYSHAGDPQQREIYHGSASTSSGHRAVLDVIDQHNNEETEAGHPLHQEPKLPVPHTKDLIGQRAAESDAKRDYWRNIDVASSKAAGVQLPGAHLFKKTDMPAAGTAGLTAPPAPALHNNVVGFLTAFKALPKEGPHRGKFITAHMNHGPFLSALKAHPQGAQVHAQLTAHLNSKANAGPKAPTQTIVKSLLFEIYKLAKAAVEPFKP